MKRILALLALVSAGPAVAEWEFKVAENPMTDAKRGISSTMAEDGDGALTIKCDSNGKDSLYVSVISKNYLGGSSRDPRREISYRIDGAEPRKTRASYSDRSASLFDTRPDTAGGYFLKDLMTAKSLVVQVNSYRYEPYFLKFDVTGAAEAINQAATTCGDTNWMP